MKNVEFAIVDTIEDLDYLINRIQNGPTFAEPFKFKSDELSEELFSRLSISIDDFTKKYFYYDATRKLHISESHEGYYWISTMGLVAPKEKTNHYDNKYVRACCAQFIVVDLLLEKAISICMDDRTYDIDGFNFNYLNELNTALFHNIIFYFEIFGKAYLSLNNISFGRIHELKELLPLVKETMFRLNQNDTVFHACIIAEFERIANYIGTIPDKFKEQYVKYDDNPGDSTVIEFSEKGLSDLAGIVAVSNDFITDYYFKKSNNEDLYEVIHLQPGLYNKYLNKAQNDEEKQRIIDTYGFLLKK